jgi:hypothetical protein
VSPGRSDGNLSAAEWVAQRAPMERLVLVPLFGNRIGCAEYFARPAPPAPPAPPIAANEREAGVQ